MTDLKLLYKTIHKRSRFLVERGEEWRKELSSAKNYITTPDLKHWTFGKSAGLNDTYHANGGAAKQWLYSMGFTNVLKLPASKWKQNVLQAFLQWCSSIKAFDIAAKYHKDQDKNQRFELLLHKSLLPVQGKATAKSMQNQKEYDEGFTQQILLELKKRNPALVQQAKGVYGTVCEGCGFDFGQTYGPHGEGFIEMHHLYPISRGSRRSTLADLRPVCANCHRMLHRGKQLFSIEELKEIIRKAKRKNRG